MQCGANYHYDVGPCTAFTHHHTQAHFAQLQPIMMAVAHGGAAGGEAEGADRMGGEGDREGAGAEREDAADQAGDRCGRRGRATVFAK